MNLLNILPVSALEYEVLFQGVKNLIEVKNPLQSISISFAILFSIIRVFYLIRKLGEVNQIKIWEWINILLIFFTLFFYKQINLFGISIQEKASYYSYNLPNKYINNYKELLEKKKENELIALQREKNKIRDGGLSEEQKKLIDEIKQYSKYNKITKEQENAILLNQSKTEISEVDNSLLSSFSLSDIWDKINNGIQSFRTPFFTNTLSFFLKLMLTLLEYIRVFALCIISIFMPLILALTILPFFKKMIISLFTLYLKLLLWPIMTGALSVTYYFISEGLISDKSNVSLLDNLKGYIYYEPLLMLTALIYVVMIPNLSDTIIEGASSAINNASGSAKGMIQKGATIVAKKIGTGGI